MTGRLGDILVESGILDRDTVERAASGALANNQKLGEYLASGIALEESDLYRALASSKDFRFATAEELYDELDAELIETVSLAYLRRHRVIPIRRKDDVVLIATCNVELNVSELLSALGGEQIETLMLTPTDFTRLWTDLHLGSIESEVEDPTTLTEEALDADLLAGEFQNQAFLVGLLGAILLDATGQRATDIHFEAYADTVRLRFRIDGDLHTIDRYHLNASQLRGLNNIIKIQCQLDITEHRRPQGGRFRRTISGHTIDMRVQTQPTLHGENVIIRLLPHSQRRFSIDELGFTPKVGRRYVRLLESPSGMILFVGPTGSGKTTSLYAGLSRLADDARRKVITIEDPVEYSINDIQQTQINEVLGYTFDTAMRVIVREDPDAILLGEIRDPATALEAARASQTGHMVLSTLHCNDSVDAVQRLFDLGLHPNSIAAEVQAVFAQRLAPRICSGCREAAPLEPDLVNEVFPHGTPTEFAAFIGHGCERCNGRGYYGRIAVIEFLPVSVELRNQISARADLETLRRTALATGLVPMRDVALSLVHQGVIAFATLRRLLLPERLLPDRPEQPFVADPDELLLS